MAAGIVPGLTAIATPGHAIAMIRDSLAEQLFESVALIAIGNAPDCVGVPDSTPPAKVMPDGRVPHSANVTVPIPPVWVKVVDWYATSTVPDGIFGGGNVITEQPIVRVKVTLPLQLLESVAVTVIGKVPV